MSEANAQGTQGDKPAPKANPALFLRQVIAELRKVVWPTQKQLVNYFWVVLVFVLVFMLLVSLLDLGFGRLAFWIFGGAN